MASRSLSEALQSRGLTTGVAPEDQALFTDAGIAQDGDTVGRKIGLEALLEAQQTAMAVGSPPEAYGATGDGTADDSAAFAAACAIVGNVIRVPAGKIYLVGDVPVADGVSLIGESGREYTTPLLDFAKPRFVKKASAACCFNVEDGDAGQGIQFSGLVFDGQDFTGTAISSNSNAMSLDRCTFNRFDVGVGGDIGPGDGYSRRLMMNRCVVASNTVGVRNPIDSRFIGCEFASNGRNVSALTGSTANSFTDCRFEWAYAGPLVSLFGCSLWNFTGCQFDRGDEAGVSISSCSHMTFAGCSFNRAGADASPDFDKNAGVFISSSSHLTFAGCLWKKGVNDDGLGNQGPQYCVTFNGANSHISFVGGSMEGGYVTAPLRYYSGGTPASLAIFGVTGIANFSNDGAGLQIVDGGAYRSAGTTSPIAVGGSAVLALSARRAVQTFTTEVPMKLRVSARNNSTGADFGAEFSVLVSREGAGAVIATSAAYGEVGAAGTIGIGSGTVSLALGNVAADGSTFDLTITNNHATNPFVVKAVLS